FGAFNISVPFNLLNQTQNLSGGVSIQSRNRTMFSDLLLVTGKEFTTLENLLAAERYYSGGLSLTSYYTKDPGLNDAKAPQNSSGNYTASSNIGASYLKLETKLLKGLSANIGIRLESSSNLVSNIQYNYLKGFKHPQLFTLNKNTRIIEFNFLPSLHVKYQPIDALQLFAGYFKSLNRPQLQELSPSRYYDAASFTVKEGNPVLVNTEIDNADLGVILNLKKGTSLTLSGFYKKVYEPIENLIYPYSTTKGTYLSRPYNVPPATIKGIEMAFKSKLNFITPALNNLSCFANTTILRSKVETGFIRNGTAPDIPEHSLSGSPDYAVNAGITLQEPGLPELSVLFNTTADYISAVGTGAISDLLNENSVQAIPDYRVKGRDQLDLQISQKFFKSRIQVILGVNNLLNAPYIVYQDLNGNRKFDEPLQLKANANGQLGYYQSGTDNTVVSIKPQRLYYLTVSYVFNK
ncbi:MAG: TonB-dependent receptor, partial [Pyrinomonadaceae bacterium]|nr:TonB-dependent receptor [Sphingobacteriaceae bacterium]